MAITRTNIGRIPLLKGAYSATTTYEKTNQVTAYGSTYQSLIDSNTGNAPYSINASTGKVSHANTDKWQCIADGASAYNAAIDAGTLETRIEGGDVVAKYSENFISWDQRSEDAVEGMMTIPIRTTAGDLSIDSDKGAKLLGIVPSGAFKATAFKASGFNLLNPSEMVGSAYVFRVPKMVQGSYGKSEEANGILFTDADGNNLHPTVRFSESYPASASAGTAVTAYRFSGHSEYFYPASAAGYFIVSELTVTAANTCAHIAWSKDYDKYVAYTAPASIALSAIMSAIVATHSTVTDKMLSVGSVSDSVAFGTSSATWSRKCSAIAPTWTNTQQADGTYKHSVTIPSTNGAMKSYGEAEIIGQAITLTVEDKTVSFVDSNATCEYSVKYELATVVTGTVSVSNSIAVNDMGIEYMDGADGSFVATLQYSQGIPDTVYGLINRTEEVEAQSESIADVFEEAVKRDFESLPLLCGQPAILHGNGTPQESVIPYEWNQFDPETGEGENWNGTPTAENQQYIDVSAVSAARYIAVRSSYDKNNANYYVLTWKNY